MKEPVATTRARFTERILRIDGRPFSFKDYEFFRPIYDNAGKPTVIMSGRQVAKSTACANIMLSETGIIPHFKILYSTPSKTQTSRFSTTRVGKIMNYSPEYRRAFVSNQLSQSILLRIMKNGSEIHMSYAADDADRLRGISADHVFLDEVQGILYEAVVPVVVECLSASNYNYIMYAGTPLTLENTLASLWNRSTKHHWVMRCEGCGKLNWIEDERSIGLKGPICTKCGKVLNVRPNFDTDPRKRSGFWVPENPDSPLLGYHIPQPILPHHAERKWSVLLDKMPGGILNYSQTKFRNEVLGIQTPLEHVS